MDPWVASAFWLLGMVLSVNTSLRSCFQFSAYIPELGLLNHGIVCHLCRNHHPLFHSGCTTSPLHQWYIRGPISSHLHLSFMFGFHISHSLSSHETEFKNSLILNGISYFLKQKYGKEEWLTLNSPALCVWHFSCTNSATPQPYHTRAAVWLITTTLWRRQRRSAHFKAS